MLMMSLAVPPITVATKIFNFNDYKGAATTFHLSLFSNTLLHSAAEPILPHGGSPWSIDFPAALALENRVL